MYTVKCTVCLENLPTLKVNAASICTCCHDDSHSPKLYSTQNNMYPGPVPPELKVSHRYAACMEDLSVLLFVGRELRVFGCYSFYCICFLLTLFNDMTLLSLTLCLKNHLQNLTAEERI